jgi:hypothetical protein
MLRRLFGGDKKNAPQQPSYPAGLLEYYSWLRRLPEQEIIGKTNDSSDNSLTTWTRAKLTHKYGQGTVLTCHIEKGQLHWKLYSVYGGNESTEYIPEWMGDVLTLANKRKPPITASQALADCSNIILAIEAKFKSSLAVAETLPAPPLPNQEDNTTTEPTSIICAYCQFLLPDGTARTITDIREQMTSSQTSSHTTMRIIKFTCPQCGKANEVQMNMGGQVTVSDESEEE